MTLSHTWLEEVLERVEEGKLAKGSMYVAMGKSSRWAEISQRGVGFEGSHVSLRKHKNFLARQVWNHDLGQSLVPYLE